MRPIKNQFEIDMISRNRQRLEIEMAGELYQVYSGGQLFFRIKDLVSELLHLLKSVDPGVVYNEYARAPYRAKRLGPAAPAGTLIDRLQAAKVRWDLADCSDFIRLFGEVVEKAKTISGSNMDAQKTLYRPADMFDKQVARKRIDLPQVAVASLKAKQQASGRPTQWSVFLNARPPQILTKKFLGYVTAITEAEAKQKAIISYPQMKLKLPGVQKDLPGSITPADIAVTLGLAESTAQMIGKTDRMDSQRPLMKSWIMPGMERYDLEEGSIIGRMSLAFGLKPEGGDISGTTTDSIYALDWASLQTQNPKTAALLPILQLLPLVTMVYQGHHSLLECAVPLSLQPVGRLQKIRYLDYSIGYYTTLWPLNQRTTDAGEVYEILKKFEESHRSHDNHVLTWKEQGRLCGWVMQSADLEKFKEVARVNNIYETFKGNWPGHERACAVGMLLEKGLHPPELPRIQ